MENTNIIESLGNILPELNVALFLVIILLFDLIYPDRKKLLPYIAASGIIITVVLVCSSLFGFEFAFAKGNSVNNSTGMIAIDPLGGFFKLLILISALMIIYFTESAEEMTAAKGRMGEYYTLIYGMILGMLLLASAADLILIYLSIELLSLSSYVLAGFLKLRERNSEASLKYIIYGAVASGMMLFGISILFGLTGTTNLVALNETIPLLSLSALTLGLAVILILAGFGFKISMAPFHFWTPDVYEGSPISITAFLSVASKAAGFIVLIRFVRTAFVSVVHQTGSWEILPIFEWQYVLIGFAILTMTLGNFSALWQSNMKRMLAFSSIAHAGYILLGLAVLTDKGLSAVLIYFAIYMIMNLGAFFVVMLIANKINSEDMHDYNGLGITSPILGVTLAIFLISLTGLPPTAGFIAKLYLFIALIDADMITVAIIALLNTVVSLYYYVRVLKHLFLKNPEEETVKIESSPNQTWFVIGLSTLVIIFGLYFEPLVNFAQSCVKMIGN